MSLRANRKRAANPSPFAPIGRSLDCMQHYWLALGETVKSAAITICVLFLLSNAAKAEWSVRVKPAHDENRGANAGPGFRFRRNPGYCAPWMIFRLRRRSS